MVLRQALLHMMHVFRSAPCQITVLALSLLAARPKLATVLVSVAVLDPHPARPTTVKKHDYPSAPCVEVGYDIALLERHH
jgi:hypothetical protein